MSLPLGLLVGRVPVIGAGRRELAELVADHVFGDIDRHMLVAVVDAERQADELRQDRRAAAPDLDDLVAAARARPSRPSSAGSRRRTDPSKLNVSWLSGPSSRDALRTMNLSVALFLRVFLPLVGLPHGVTGCRPPEVRPSPPPCGWSTGFMVTPRLTGLRPSQRLRPALPIEVLAWSGFDTAPTVAMQVP